MSTAVSKTPRARDDNDYDAPPNIRNVNPLRGAAATFMNLLSTHPPIEERIRRLQAMRA